MRENLRKEIQLIHFQPEGGQTDDDWDNLAFFAMVDCREDDGKTPLEAGECPSGKWSAYFNINQNLEFGDTESLDAIYNMPERVLQNTFKGRFGACPSKEMVTGLKEFTQIIKIFYL